MAASPVPAIPIAQLEQHIEQDIEACEALLQLLAAERQALKERDLDTLDELIQQKSHYLNRLETSAQTRAQWVNQSTSDGTRPANPEQRWATWLAQWPASITEQWQSLRQLWHKCQTENEVNGKILARKEQTYSQLLGKLRGQNATPDLYNAKGSRGARTGGHTLGEA